MSYSANIRQEREQSAKDRAARNIHERLEKIILTSAGEAKRRWFWELLQNARDVSDSAGSIRVKVGFREEGSGYKLVFAHNGGAFASGDLVRLTEQDSNKRKDTPAGRLDPIGRFGTGFLTTHLLARIVEVEGVVSDAGEQPKRFHLPLDRSGDTEEALRRGVKATFQALSTLDEQPPLKDYQPGGFDTRFIYWS